MITKRNLALLALMVAARLDGKVVTSIPSLTITIRLVDYAGIDARTLESAEENAGNIFRHAGVALVWQQCPPRAPRGTAPSCTGPLGANDFWLYIAKWRPAGASPDSLGLTVLTAGSEPTVAWVDYPRVAEMAAHSYLEESSVLAGTLAHEIGHLLGSRHAQRGVMCASLNRRDIVELTQGRLLFTPAQAALIRSEIVRRRSLLPLL